jgi:hypothetical protein
VCWGCRRSRIACDVITHAIIDSFWKTRFYTNVLFLHHTVPLSWHVQLITSLWRKRSKGFYKFSISKINRCSRFKYISMTITYHCPTRIPFDGIDLFAFRLPPCFCSMSHFDCNIFSCVSNSVHTIHLTKSYKPLSPFLRILPTATLPPRSLETSELPRS